MDKNMSLELLTRYEPDISCGPPCCGTMAESSKGEYVKFSDVERLLAAPSAAQVQASNITNQQANDEKQTRADDQGHAQDAQDDAGAVGAGGRAGADQYNEHREGQSGNQHGNAGRNCGSSGVSGEVSVRAGEVGAAPIAAAPAAPEQWISTTERMPEDGQTVRILCPDPTPEAWDAKWNAGSQTFESKANGWVRGAEVSHWMPKPAATEQDAKDAARYRWLRDQNIMAQVGSYSPYVVQGQTMRMLEGTEVDAAVDAAMKTATNEGDHDA